MITKWCCLARSFGPSTLLFSKLDGSMIWFVALLILCMGQAVIADEPIDVVAVLNRIVSRSEQIQTGVFEFSVTEKTLSAPANAPELRVIVKNIGTESERHSLGFLKPPPGKQFPHYQVSDLTVSDEFSQFRKVSVAGDDWVAHCPAVPSTEIGHGDFASTYTERTHCNSGCTKHPSHAGISMKPTERSCRMQ